MPAEVIDLLSSSPEPEAARKTTTAKTFAKPTTKPAAIERANPVSSNWNWDALTTNNDENLPKSIAPKPRPVTALTERTCTTNNSRNPIISPRKSASGFVDLLDDDSDDPFKSPPPAKRRRVSSSPQPIHSKSFVPKASRYNRSISNIESSTRVMGSWKSTNAPILKRTSAKKPADDILFTSSPDYIAEAARKRKEREKKSQLWERDDHSLLESDDDLPSLSAIRNHKSKPLAKTNKATTTIDEDDDENGHDLPRRSKKTSVASQFRLEGFDLSSDIEEPAMKPPKTSKAKGTSQSALDKYNAENAKEKARERKEREKKEKAAAKEAENEKKRLERVEKARRKEKDAEITKANTRRTDKKVSIKEMIVDIPSCLNLKVKDQVRIYLAEKANHTEYETTIPVLKWRRNVDRVYNEEIDMWEAVPKRVETEDHVMCILLAKEFVDLAKGEEGQDLNAHVLDLKAKHDSCKVIYLIEGFRSWTSKNRSIQNKKWEAGVNRHLPQAQEAPTASQRRKKKEEEYVDEDLVEDKFLDLQVEHNVLIHHTDVWNQTAEWILRFTEQISLKPEKLRSRILDTAFCMETGQVKTGENAQDTYVKMLQEMKRVTQPIAWGIVSEYPTVQQLVRGLEEEGEMALADCRKSANGNGAFQEGRIGPAISKRLHKIFTGRDPFSTEV